VGSIIDLLKWYYKLKENLLLKKCPRGEIGRHKGLKILALLGVPVRVWPRAPQQL
tara:strand:- start:1691 stop:1855 length:165 start_codon:yes stop_codon:yes gene_type:complete